MNEKRASKVYCGLIIFISIGIISIISFLIYDNYFSDNHASEIPIIVYIDGARYISHPGIQFTGEDKDEIFESHFVIQKNLDTAPKDNGEASNLMVGTKIYRLSEEYMNKYSSPTYYYYFDSITDTWKSLLMMTQNLEDIEKLYP